MSNTPVLKGHKEKIYGGAFSIYDNESINFLKNIQVQQGNLKKFLDDYREWIGLDLQNFKHTVFSNGTTEAFDKFYFKNIGRRLRIFKGEYFFHQLMARNYFKMQWLEDGPIDKNDFVIISCPFSDTGDIPTNFYSVLKSCDEQDVPVLIDMAYINISNLKNIDLNFKCIKTITTSLSKVFPVEHYRIGIRFDKDLYDDTLLAYNQNQYVNLYSVNVGHELIKKFSNDWLYTKYKDKQQEFCKKLNVELSPCVIFGIDKKNNFTDYNRGSDTNRLCFSRVWDQRL